MTQSATILDRPSIWAQAGVVRIEYEFEGKALSFDLELSKDTHRDRIIKTIAWGLRKKIVLHVSAETNDLLAFAALIN